MNKFFSSAGTDAPIQENQAGMPNKMPVVCQDNKPVPIIEMAGL
jgi:hypothetical protein